MWRKARYILAAVFIAYLLGMAPTIINFFSEKILVSSGEGTQHCPEFFCYMSGVLAKLHEYSIYFMVVYAAVIAVLIFLEYNNPDRTLLWLAVLIFVPVLGLIIYLIIGPDFENLRRRRDFRTKEFAPVAEEHKTDMRIQTAQLLREVVGAELMFHNDVKILINGDELYPALLKAIAEAKTYIHFQFFILRDDETGRVFRDALVEAAERGVKVRVLYDAIGSRGITTAYVKSLKEKGIPCFSFMPVSFPTFRRRMNYRNHRKICVIDGRIGFTGGLNISNDYIHKGKMGFWRDTHVQIKGEAVKDLDKIFLDDWEYRTEEPIEKIIEEDNVRYETDFSNLPVIPTQVVPSGVSSAWHSIEMGFASVIARAKERVWLATPYLVPGATIISLLNIAALSGIDVRIMIPEKCDSFLVDWASKGNLEGLLRAGVRVYLYKKGFIHAKTTLTDSVICSAGTCNLDVRSLEINFEDQVFIYDKETATSFAEQYEKDIKDCKEIGLEEWQKRGFWRRMLESFGKLYSAQI